MMSRITFWIITCYFLTQSLAIASDTTAGKEPLKSTSAATEISLMDKNLVSGKAFLEENKKNPEIHTLPSGLQYKIIKEGAGDSPGPTDFVVVNYRGALIDGTEFDSSYTHHSPITLAVNSTIPGWVEALQLMKPGAQWTIYLPPQLAYGKEGAGSRIGPNMTLIFDIELLSVKPSLDENQNSLSGEIEDEG